MKVDPLNDMQKIQGPDPLSSASISPAQMSPAVAAPAADDLGALFSQEVELHSKAMSLRQLNVRVTPVAQLSQLYDQLGHPAQASLAAISRKVRVQLLQHSSVDSLLELTGNDPARTYVVLKQITAQAEAEVRKAEVVLARDALAKLEIRFKGEIQAGLNIAMALQASSDDPELRQAVRTLYYSSVVARQSLVTLMQALLGLFGGEQFSTGLKVMRRALADDIAAHTPSVACAKLRTLLLGLQSCGQLSSVLSYCRELVQHLPPMHPAGAPDAVILLQRLLGYASTGIAPPEVQRLGNEFGGEQPSSQLISLNAIYPVIQRLPLALWQDSRGRQEVLHNFLLVMDEYTRNERSAQQLANTPELEQ
ncbi:YopN family type III secretion system gatekeeper subunit [Pseudomonas sp. CCM 7891]|uniref:YopN family type III secretion system gatekeeper subunit n=1 Tax=Pseudomonas karstica TaxID=1055468 RepID=A0A7X2UXP0_9PSED|nr:type III secretion system gatekeeper subunit SctW [Pseudomonas karstica]MTD19931.1 YopN family type III secretion system gatekeeper subunit [Pseudomonas karstica]